MTKNAFDTSKLDNSPMAPEVRAAVQFLTSLVKQRCRGMASSFLPSQDVLERLEWALGQVLVDHYADHWFPGTPWRGGAFRCIRINGNMDPLIAKAGAQVNVDPQRLRACFPPELTIWIDPGNVSYRIGEEGSVCELYGEPPYGPDSEEEGSPSLHTAKSAPLLSSKRRPSPPVSPESMDVRSTRSSPVPLVLGSPPSLPGSTSTMSSGCSFGYAGHGPPALSGAGNHLAESLASLMLISEQQQQQHAHQAAPSFGLGPPHAPRGLLFNEQSRWGAQTLAGTTGGYGSAESGVCKDNLDLLARCMEQPMVIASLGSA